MSCPHYLIIIWVKLLSKSLGSWTMDYRQWFNHGSLITLGYSFQIGFDLESGQNHQF